MPHHMWERLWRTIDCMVSFKGLSREVGCMALKSMLASIWRDQGVESIDSWRANCTIWHAMWLAWIRIGPLSKSRADCHRSTNSDNNLIDCCTFGRWTQLILTLSIWLNESQTGACAVLGWWGGIECQACRKRPSRQMKAVLQSSQESAPINYISDSNVITDMPATVLSLI